MTTLTAAQCMADRAADSSAFGRSPLPALVLLSLALHAATIGLWPEDAMVISEPLPAGPIALHLQNASANGLHTSTPIEAATQPVSKAVDAVRKKPDAPRKTEPAQRPARHTASHDPIEKPSVTQSVAATATGDELSAADTATAANITQTGDAIREQLRGRLQSALIAHFDYPLVARRRGWEGVVRVGLRVEADGQLTRLRVIDSSGHALLDRAALSSLGRVGRLPDVMDWLQGRRFDMVLPVRYQLIDS